MTELITAAFYLGILIAALYLGILVGFFALALVLLSVTVRASIGFYKWRRRLNQVGKVN